MERTPNIVLAAPGTDWLGQAMTLANLQTGKLANASGVSRSQLQRIRGGDEPRLSTLRAIRAALADHGVKVEIGEAA